ncbi:MULTISPECIES: helveticin J family class III bacteriocin [unclassified Lactobacillus]|uniref:helveticin J family class III bacteriocin n=1 Tax=unclassified Lactobacillus TaxID=2620435 RepID=UPI000EFC7481|nr:MULTISPECIES: helveticin J family class III bacteriocin [unclassified Lactobacillus]RMC26038.1 bacteriocin [Lactobacillus sp. ESL0247]RMC29731.1 bacteriocin [Lactobacillus sp. ESL0246]RMC34136.1 bacteriocin [Lactobacillus sp. ESL0245]
MKNIRNVTPHLEYELNGVHHTVVQKGNVATKYIYELQQLKQGTDTVVYRALKNGLNTTFTKNGYRLYLKGIKVGGTAGAHTQTWEYAGPNGNGEWFVGTKPKNSPGTDKYWASQIARVKFANQVYSKNTELPRLSALNRAGSGYDDGSVVYPGTDLVRSEGAVSPEYTWMLIATIDNNETAHFGFYSVNEINAAINKYGTTNYPLDQFTCYYAFKVEDFVKKVDSIQGFDIDEDKNIYVSSEKAPKSNKNGKLEAQTRRIFKIPYGAKGDTSLWEVIDLNANNTDGNNTSVLERSGFLTEFESIQVAGPNDIYLTVSYHDKTAGTTLHSRIYEITW